MRLFTALLLCLGLAAPAVASDLSVSLSTPGGAPIADAVVMVAPEAGVHGARPLAGPFQMAQKDMEFQPFVLIVPVGADVAFPNLDRVRHHVYSFSPAKTFELKLYGRDETRVVHFDKPGVVPLGCNIHDSMVAFVLVVDTPYAGMTDASGQAVIHGVPPGAQAVRVWHPYLRAPGNAVSVAAAVPQDGAVRVQATGDLWTPVQPHRMY